MWFRCWLFNGFELGEHHATEPRSQEAPRWDTKRHEHGGTAKLGCQLGLTASDVGASNPAAAASGLSQDVAAFSLGAPATSTALHFCSVPGCLSAAGGRRPGWETDGQGLRNHVDAHLLGQLPGLPPETWMNNRRMVVCRICGRMVSRRCNNGMHRACLASDSTPTVPSLTPAPMRIRTGEPMDDLPTLMNIFAVRIETREFVGASLFLAVEREFNKCTANVIAQSRPDAWQHIDTPADSLDRLRARTVWIERFMFAKTCLLVLPGGVAKDARNNNIIANRIARWTAGERMSLWLEGMKMTGADQPPRKARKRPQTATGDEAEEERSQDGKRSDVISLARRGLPGKAAQHASSMGLAPDTAATEATMRSKFVAPPPSQSTSRRQLQTKSPRGP